jgi:hypothetical protein
MERTKDSLIADNPKSAFLGKLKKSAKNILS